MLRLLFKKHHLKIIKHLKSTTINLEKIEQKDSSEEEDEIDLDVKSLQQVVRLKEKKKIDKKIYEMLCSKYLDEEQKKKAIGGNKEESKMEFGANDSIRKLLEEGDNNFSGKKSKKNSSKIPKMIKDVESFNET